MKKLTQKFALITLVACLALPLTSMAEDEYLLSEATYKSLNAAQEKIYTCISPYTDNVLTPISGQTEFAIAFEIVSPFPNSNHATIDLQICIPLSLII